MKTIMMVLVMLLLTTGMAMCQQFQPPQMQQFQQPQQSIQQLQNRMTFTVIFPRYMSPALLSQILGGDTIYDEFGGQSGGYGNQSGSGSQSGYGGNSGNSGYGNDQSSQGNSSSRGSRGRSSRR